jgi:hypothetical protein
MLLASHDFDELERDMPTIHHLLRELPVCASPTDKSNTEL